MAQKVQIHLYTAYFHIHGLVMPGPTGMYSHMNLPTVSHLEVHQASITPLYQLGGEEAHRDKLWLVKQKVVVVVLERQSEMGTSSLTRRGYTRPFPHWVRAEVGDYELAGMLHLGGNFEMGEILSQSERRFIPLYKAKLGSALYPALHVEKPVMLFNRRWLQGMALLTPREIPEGEKEY